MNPYTEDKMVALPYRRRMLDETNAYIASLRRECDRERAAYFTPDFTSVAAYRDSTVKYRNDLIKMLGKPLTDYPDTVPTGAERLKLGSDEYGNIERIWVEAAPGLWSYGLLFTPFGNEPSPYVTALHGGLGTSEIVSSFYASCNYNDMVQRIRKSARVTVYAPQMLLWGDGYDEADSDKSNHIEFDIKLKQCGGSVASLEIFRIMRTVDWICANLPIDSQRMGVVGLSYGGFYTLFHAAIDCRYKMALSSCFFNDRWRYPWEDWTWFGSGAKLNDAEIAALIAPRGLCVQVGKEDNLFNPESAKAEFAKVADIYRKLGLDGNCRFSIKAGGHQFSPEADDLAWFMRKL